MPPLPEQLATVGGDRERFDAELRPALVRRAIAAVQAAGVEVATWKIEGIERREDCEAIAAACRADGRGAGCLILGRGADEAKVEHWLPLAAPVAGFDGFAVGRTIWWDAIAAQLAGELDARADGGDDRRPLPPLRRRLPRRPRRGLTDRRSRRRTPLV